MSENTYSDRRNATSNWQIIQLEDDRISVFEDNRIKRAIRLEDIVRIRLGVEMAGRQNQVVCRIYAADETEIVFGSRAWIGVGEWKNQGPDFMTFNTRLHAHLMDHRDSIEFLEGQPLWFGWVMSGLGAAIMLMGAAFAAFLLMDGNPVGWGGFPGVLLGLYLIWMFRPRAPQPYDPAVYAEADQ